MKVEFYRHHIQDEDIENVADVLRSIFLTTGPVTDRFEKKFSQYTGLKHAIGVNSCTAALHLSLLALNIGPGDEVITTPMTFIASANAILHAGATPVFVDVEKETGLMDVANVESAITGKTRAILPVHLYGSMVDMVSLKKIADMHGLSIIEDCAHCIEAERDGIRPGQVGDAACYSFYATKNLTCGEGGAVGTNNEQLTERLKVLRLHGMSKDAASRYSGFYRHWDMVELGWKYNMSDIQAALLIDQIDRLDEMWKKREQICHRYDEGLKSCAGIRLPETRGKSARHLYTIWVEAMERDAALYELQKHDIGVAVNYRAVHTLNYYREHFGYLPGDFPVAESIGDKTVTLPLYFDLTELQVDFVIETIRKIFERPI